jgi:hypothetical protein
VTLAALDQQGDWTLGRLTHRGYAQGCAFLHVVPVIFLLISVILDGSCRLRPMVVLLIAASWHATCPLRPQRMSPG